MTRFASLAALATLSPPIEDVERDQVLWQSSRLRGTA